MGSLDPAAIDLVGDLNKNQSAQGHGTVVFAKPFAQPYSFSFTARRTDDFDKKTVAAAGQFEFHPEGKTELKVHGEVVCLTVIRKNTAVIGGVVTHSNAKDLPPGQDVIFEAIDNGEGDSNPLDTLSPLVPTFKGGAIKACVTPKFLQGPIIRDGNIQVPLVTTKAP